MGHFGFLLLGIGAGSVYGALALALVVTYRSSGVINFASGSIAAYAAFIYGFLRQGEFPPMIPGLKPTYRLPFVASFFPALFAALLLSSLLGLVLYLLIFRPLRSAPPLARVVATLGVQVAIVLLIVKQLGSTQLPVAKFLPDSRFKLGETVVHTDRMLVALITLGAALLVAALFRFTRFGLATRAAAETEEGAVVSRLSPNRLAAANWMLSSAVAGLAGVMISPLIAVVPAVFSLFIVPSLAGAVVARFERLAPAVIAGVLVGMFESEATNLHSVYSWFPRSGGTELVSLVVIGGALLLRGAPLPARGALIQRSMGRSPRPRSVVPTSVIGLATGGIALVLMTGGWRSALILSFIFGIISLSLVVVTGYAGQVSLAQLTLAGTSAYALSYLTRSLHVPFPIAPLLSALVAMVLGEIVGLPALRVRGLSVAVVTLSLATTLDALWFRNTDIVGFRGGVQVSDPKLFGWFVGFGKTRNANHLSFGYTVLVTLVLTAVGVALLRRSRLGSAMVAVRANERSAAAAGVDVLKVKIAAFAIGSFIAGLGGAMLAYRYGTITYDQFTPLLGLTVFASVYLAGITSVSGGVVAGMLCITGVAYTASNNWLHLGKWYQLISSILLLVTVINNPEGIVGANHLMADKFAAKRKARRGGLVEPTAPQSVPLVAEPKDVADRPALLEIRNLRVAYGGVVAVADVSFDVPEGAIVGLIGPNGAGKTTMVDALSGFAEHTGTVTFAGADIGGLKPHQRVQRGLSRTFQAIELYDDLNVQENLEVGMTSGRQGRGAAATAVLDEACTVLDLSAHRDRQAADLSQGQRQLVSIGRALVAKPRLLLLDEPAAGLDSAESGWLGHRLREVRDEGVTILMVDHDVNLVLNLCDYIVVLDFGSLIASGTPNQIRNNPAVISAYLGSTHSEPVGANEGGDRS